MRCPTNVMRMFCIFKIIREHRIPHFMECPMATEIYCKGYERQRKANDKSHQINEQIMP